MSSQFNFDSFNDLKKLEIHQLGTPLNGGILISKQTEYVRNPNLYWAPQKNLVKGLDCYCVSCELLSAYIADALLFVNILVLGIFHGRFAQRLAVNKLRFHSRHLMICKHGLFTANR